MPSNKKVSLDLPNFKNPNLVAAPQDEQANQAATVSYAIKNTLPGSSSNRASLPLLPRGKRPSFSSHRNDANAALALDLLADVEAAIVGWHDSLRQILLEIQKLYMAGPIVEGWLESVNRSESPPDLAEQAAVLRHGDAEQVAAYVEKLAQQPPAVEMKQSTQYRLCRLDAEGQLHCQVCPPEQLGIISQAIARNQQLRQLLNQKHYLEARLKRAAEALEVTRKTLDLHR